MKAAKSLRAGLLALAIFPFQPGWALVTILSEGFEGVFPGAWLVGDANIAGTPAYWRDVDAAFGGEGTHNGNWKGYCAGNGYGGTSADPLYQDNMAAYMRHTNLSLTGYSSATLQFWFRIPSIEMCCDGARVYIDGSLVWATNRPVGAWTEAVVDLTPFVGATRTLAFEFQSDGSVTNEGWYLDDLLVAGVSTSPPANDACVGAIALTLGGPAAVVDTTRATSAGDPTPMCQASFGRGVWFAYAAADSRRVTVSTCASGFDTVLQVYTGGCGSLVPLPGGCNDDYGPACPSAPQASVSFDAVAGTVYHLLVGGYGGRSGEVQVSVMDLTPPVLVSATGSHSLMEATLHFSEPLDPVSAANLSNYSAPGLGVAAAQLRADGRSVALTLLASQTPGMTYTAFVNDVRDRSGLAVLPGSSASFQAFALGSGFAVREVFRSLAGNQVADLRSAPVFPHSPDDVCYVLQLESPPNVADHYGVRLSGWLHPPVSGDYTFWMCSDDNGEFWLSADASPAGLARVAYEPYWNLYRDYTGADRRNPAAPENRSAPIPLLAGQAYYFEALMKEDVGGDNLSVTWQRPGDGPPRNGDPPIPGAYLSCAVDPTAVSLSITQPPADAVYVRDPYGAVASNVTFTVGAHTEAPGCAGVPLAYQWYWNGAAMPGEVGSSYTRTDPALSDNGGQVSVQVRAPGASVFSSSARLTVVQPNTPPSLMLGADVGDGCGVGPVVIPHWARNVQVHSIPRVPIVYGSDFSSLPPGASIYGSAAVADGVLKLTDAVNGQSGSFLTPTLPGPVSDFVLEALVRLGDSSCCTAGRNELRPADGLSFNFASDLPDGTFGDAEEGAGSGLRLSLDTWDNGDPDSAPAIELIYDGVVRAVAPMDGWRDDNTPAASPVLLDPQNGAPLTLYTDARDQTFVRIASGPRQDDIFPCHQGDTSQDLAVLPGGELAGPTLYVGLAENPATIPTAPATGWIALVQRGIATFGTKATNVLNAGYAGMVLFNDAARGEDHFAMSMGGFNGFPAVMLGHAAGLAVAGVGSAGELAVGQPGAAASLRRATPWVASYAPLVWKIHANGRADVWWKGVRVITNAPTGYQPQGGRFGIGARTGTANESHWIDSLQMISHAVDDSMAEAWQTLQFLVTSDNPALFSVQPAIDSQGTLTYTPSGLSGVANVMVVLQDDGGTAYGGGNTCGPYWFRITRGKPVRIQMVPGNRMMVDWSCPGTLQGAPAVSGPWTDVVGATSPYVFSPLAPAGFFRLRP